VIQIALLPPSTGRTRWTTRLIAKQVGITSGSVSSVLRRHEVEPHQAPSGSNLQGEPIPRFAAKVKDIVRHHLR
jgi:hypothetical protein